MVGDRHSDIAGGTRLRHPVGRRRLGLRLGRLSCEPPSPTSWSSGQRTCELCSTWFDPRPAAEPVACRCQSPALLWSRAMTLHLHRAERADRLVAALGALLSTPLPTRSAPRSSPSPPPASSAGCPSACPASSAHARAARTGSAPASTSARRAGWSPGRSARGASRTPTTSTRGSRTGRSGRCWRSSTAAGASPGPALLWSYLGERRIRGGSGARWPPLVDGPPSGRPVRAGTPPPARDDRTLAPRARSGR